MKTASATTTIILDAPDDSLNHYGEAKAVTVEAIYTSSYHEYGSISGIINLKKGQAVIESGAKAECILIDTTAEDFDSEATIIANNTKEPSVKVVFKIAEGSSPSDFEKVEINANPESVEESSFKIAENAGQLVEYAAAGNVNIQLRQDVYNIGKNEDGIGNLVFGDNVVISGAIDESGKPATTLNIFGEDPETISRLLFKGENGRLENVVIETSWQDDEFGMGGIRLYGKAATIRNCKFNPTAKGDQFACGDIYNLDIIDCAVSNYKHFIYAYGIDGIATQFIQKEGQHDGVIHIKGSSIVDIAEYVLHIDGPGSWLIEDTTIMTYWSSFGSSAAATFNNCRILHNPNGDFGDDCNGYNSHQLITFNECEIEDGIYFYCGTVATCGYAITNTTYNGVLMTKDNYISITPDDCEWSKVNNIVINGIRVK